LRAAGAQIVLANTYHLFLRPGHDVVQELGGLHRFMAWNGPILTDSGGFQVWSLAKLRKIGEDGVEFRSHVDGSLRFLSPEICVTVQHALGVDILHPLDECLAYPATVEATERSLALTLRWLRRSVAAHGHGAGALFGIIQGGAIPELRRRAVEEVCALDLDGHAIGGLAVGEPKDVMYATTELCAGLLPADRPRYLMGVGTPEDLIEGVARGVDLFDCVMPTRNARNGQLFTRHGKLMVRNARYRNDPRPPDPDCGCPTCRTTSRAYLRHLHLAGEMSAATLATLHNLWFYLDTMRAMRQSIRLCRFQEFRTEALRMLLARAPEP
jgi:queuine tRNA-ribosyltransferase